MDVSAILELQPELHRFLEVFAEGFRHPRNLLHAQQYLHGLFWGGERRNIENIAQAIEGSGVRSLQTFISQARWDDEALLEQLQLQISQCLGTPQGALIVDETGFAKKGTKSVGVQRQYSGTLGRVDNCPIGVLLGYHSSHGPTLIDRRLFLPQGWVQDVPRRKEARVPEEVIYRTKPELALDMIVQAWLRGMPFGWVLGDTLYGNSPTFVQGIRLLNKLYVLDVGSEMHVWLSEPQPEQSPIPVGEVWDQSPELVWKRVKVAEGSQGDRLYDYAEVEVWFSEEGKPSKRERLLIRRSLHQEPQIKYQRTNAEGSIDLEAVAQIGNGGWSIEVDIQAAKGECGLDEYETRGWVGWHHHTILTLLGQWFLVSQSLRLGEKKTPLECECGERVNGLVVEVTRMENGAAVGMASVETKPQSHCSDLSCQATPTILRFVSATTFVAL
jgi:SRSO17 transposase